MTSLYFFCWLAAWERPYVRSPWQLNNFTVKILIPATALAAILQLRNSITPTALYILSNILQSVLKRYIAFCVNE